MFSDFASRPQTMSFIVSESGVHSVLDHTSEVPICIDSPTLAARNELPYNPTATASVKPEVNHTELTSPVSAMTTANQHIHEGFKVELDDSEWAAYFPELFQGDDVDLSFDLDGDLALVKNSTANQELSVTLPSVELVNAKTLLRSNGNNPQLICRAV